MKLAKNTIIDKVVLIMALVAILIFLNLFFPISWIIVFAIWGLYSITWNKLFRKKKLQCEEN